MSIHDSPIHRVEADARQTKYNFTPDSIRRSAVRARRIGNLTDGNLRAALLLRELLKSEVTDTVLLPVLEVEVPPFVFVDRESFRFHCAAE